MISRVESDRRALLVFSLMLVIFCAFTSVAVPAAMALSSSLRLVSVGVIQWQGASVVRCGGSVSAQAVVYQGNQTPTASNGCSQTWLVILPPSEHGNLTAEVAYFEQNRGVFSGVVIDDFNPSPPVVELLAPAYRQLLSDTSNVCVVAYPNWGQPGITDGGPCVIVPIPIGPTDTATVSRDLAGFDASLIMPLIYGAPANHWSGPMPPASAYADVVEQTAAQLGVPVVIWH